MATLKQRLTKRGTESPKDLAQRLSDATHELAAAAATPFHARILNDDLDTAYEQVHELLRPQMLACRRRYYVPTE